MKRAKPRTKNDHARKGTKEIYSGDLHLIVTEGSKTEPKYFEDLKARWKLSADIEGAPTGNSPDTLVDYAVEKKNERKREASRGGRPNYNEVWCVFDRDGHTTLDAALDKAKANRIKVALSVPCFEIWLLLHFGFSTKPFAKCDDVIHDLKKNLPNKNYAKSSMPLNLFFVKLDDALKHAAQLRKHCEDTDTTNPSTEVDKLVKLLKQSRPTP